MRKSRWRVISVSRRLIAHLPQSDVAPAHLAPGLLSEVVSSAFVSFSLLSSGRAKSPSPCRECRFVSTLLLHRLPAAAGRRLVTPLSRLRGLGHRHLTPAIGVRTLIDFTFFPGHLIHLLSGSMGCTFPPLCLSRMETGLHERLFEIYRGTPYEYIPPCSKRRYPPCGAGYLANLNIISSSSW